MTSTESRSTRCVRSGGAWLSTTKSISRPSSDSSSARRSSRSDSCAPRAGAGSSSTATSRSLLSRASPPRNAAEQVDRRDTPLSAPESSPEPFDCAGCVHGPNHARRGVALHPPRRAASARTLAMRYRLQVRGRLDGCIESTTRHRCTLPAATVPPRPPTRQSRLPRAGWIVPATNIPSRQMCPRRLGMRRLGTTRGRAAPRRGGRPEPPCRRPSQSSLPDRSGS